MRSSYDILIKPVVTERSVQLAQTESKYTFIVESKANKIEIKNAVEKLFKVNVLSVNTINVRGKVKKVGRYTGSTPDRKKAIVSLKPGDKIEIFEGLL